MGLMKKIATVAVVFSVVGPVVTYGDGWSINTAKISVLGGEGASDCEIQLDSSTIVNCIYSTGPGPSAWNCDDPYELSFPNEDDEYTLERSDGLKYIFYDSEVAYVYNRLKRIEGPDDPASFGEGYRNGWTFAYDRSDLYCITAHVVVDSENVRYHYLIDGDFVYEFLIEDEETAFSCFTTEEPVYDIFQSYALMGWIGNINWRDIGKPNEPPIWPPDDPREPRDPEPEPEQPPPLPDDPPVSFPPVPPNPRGPISHPCQFQSNEMNCQDCCEFWGFVLDCYYACSEYY